MMISYKALSGVEIQHWQGHIYFWMPWGVYSVACDTLHCHGKYHGPRHVCFHLLDLYNGHKGTYDEIFPESFDDMEIINRFVTGTGACDCVRGKMLYSSHVLQIPRFECNKRDNRFILQKMVIKGEKLNCILSYKGYI